MKTTNSSSQLMFLHLMTQKVKAVHPEADVRVAWEAVSKIKRKLSITNLRNQTKYNLSTTKTNMLCL